MNRGRLIAVVAGAAVLAGAIVVLRGGVQPPARPVVSPDGERITAYHDPALVDPPQRTGSPPQQPGRLHTDARRGGALVSWPPAPYGFEVRWGRSGEEPRNVRYVASSSTSLQDLPPGRYRVEVRSVDELGRRSEPSSTDVEVSDRTPPWQQGLGFVEDFTAGADLGPDRWRLTDFVRRCTRREGDPGPILLDGNCGALLRPTSPLVLSEPDADGVRGRVVVLADSPPPPATPVPPPPRAPEPEPPPPPPPDWLQSNLLVISLSPAPSPMPMLAPVDGIQLRIGSHGAFLGIQRGTGTGQQFEPPDEHRLDAPRPGSPGALRRWELVFTADQVQVHLDGQQVGSVEYRPPWQRAEVTLYPMIVSDNPPPGGARIGLVGLTGPAPDGRATELIELTRGANSPEAVQRFPVAAAPSAVSAQLRGLLIGSGEVSQTGELPPPPPVTIEVGGRRLELRLQSNAEQFGPSDWFVADVPVAALGSNTAVTMRSEDGTDFTAVTMELEIVHRAGVRLETLHPDVVRPGRLAAATPRLVVRHGQQVLDSGRPVPRDRLEVEVQLDGVSAQGAAGHLAGYVALRVELDGRRILDFPTATDGPAVTGTYRFTLDVTELPAGSYQNLVARLIPDRADAANRSEPFVVRMARG